MLTVARWAWLAVVLSVPVTLVVAGLVFWWADRRSARRRATHLDRAHRSWPVSPAHQPAEPTEWWRLPR